MTTCKNEMCANVLEEMYCDVEMLDFEIEGGCSDWAFDIWNEVGVEPTAVAIEGRICALACRRDRLIAIIKTMS